MNTKGLIDSVLRGMASFVDAYVVHDYSYPHKSTETAMRGDWERVRAYFRYAVDHAVEQEQMNGIDENVE